MIKPPEKPCKVEILFLDGSHYEFDCPQRPEHDGALVAIKEKTGAEHFYSMRIVKEIIVT